MKPPPQQTSSLPFLTPFIFLLLLHFPMTKAQNLFFEMEQEEKFVTVGYNAASFAIDLAKEDCRKTMKMGVIVQSSPSVNPNDYFSVVINSEKTKASMKVTKTPDPDAIEYFRSFEAQVRIDFSSQECEPSIGGIKMQILDSNDNAPVFDAATKVLSVDENLDRKVPLLVKASDEDYDKKSNGRVTFRLADVKPATYRDVISLDANSGQLTIDPAKSANLLFDRETDPQVNLFVEASDNPTEGQNDAVYGKHVESEVITLKINDVNDNPPKDCRLKSACKVKEDHPVKGILQDCLVVCEDADEIPVFKVKDPSGTCKFEVMKNTGQIRLKSLLDADGDSSSTSPTSSSSSSSSSDDTIEHCDLIAYDDVSDPSGAKEFPFTLSVTVMDVNDNYPHLVTSSLTINHNDKLVKDFIFNETIILADKDASTKHGLTIEPSQPEWKERLKFIEDARQSNGFQLQLLKDIDIKDISTLEVRLCDHLSKCGVRELAVSRVSPIIDAAGFPWWVIVVAVVVLLAVVVILLFFTRMRNKARSKDNGRLLENGGLEQQIYVEEAGEEDTENFDINLLRRPKDPDSGMYGLNNANPNPSNSSNNSIAKAPLPANPSPDSSDPNNLPLDSPTLLDMPFEDVLEDRVATLGAEGAVDAPLSFEFEGAGSLAGSLSSLASSFGEDEDVEFEDLALDTWGPRFEKLAHLYGRDHT